MAATGAAAPSGAANAPLASEDGLGVEEAALQRKPEPWAPYDAAWVTGLVSLSTAPWETATLTTGNEIDFTCDPLMNILRANHTNVTSMFIDLINKRGMTLVVQQMLIDDAYAAGLSYVDDTELVSITPLMICAVPHIEHLLRAAQRTIHFFEHASEVELEAAEAQNTGSVVKHEQPGVTNVRTKFHFSKRPVYLSVVEQNLCKYLSLYVHD